LTRIGVLELEGGKWLAMPPGFHTHVPPFNSCAETLHFAMSAMIRRREVRRGGGRRGDAVDQRLCRCRDLLGANTDAGVCQFG
jgi:hypothetical protein